MGGPAMSPASTAPVFAALGDPHRQQLLMMLVTGGQASASALAPSLEVTKLLMSAP